MVLSYKPLAHTLIDKGIKRTRLYREAEITRTTRERIAKEEPVGLDAIERMCKVLGCPIQDIVEIKEDD